MEKTEKLGLNLPEKGYKDWDIPINENFEILDSKTLQERNISKCLLEIPQDIKLELNDGVLSTEAESKVYVPNGFEADGVTPKFDEVVVSAGVTGMGWVGTVIEDYIIFYIRGGIDGTAPENCTSGTSYPASPGNGDRCYRTDLNKIYVYRTSSSSWEEGESLPLGIVRSSGTAGKLGSIEQVFNDFGWLGSILFALPGVKGLIPNGRNADGSLRNIEFTINKVLLYDTSAWGNQSQGKLVLSGTTSDDTVIRLYFQNYARFIGKDQYQYKYNEDENLWYRSSDTGATWKSRQVLILSDNVELTGGKVTSLTPKLVFSAADDQDVVKTNGIQDIYGEKTLKDILVLNTSKNQKVILKSTTIDINNPATLNNQLYFSDKNDYIYGVLQANQTATGDISFSMTARSAVDTWFSMGVTAFADGTGVATAPNPPSNATSNQVTTANWVRNIRRGMIPNWDSAGTVYSGGTALPSDGFVYVIAIQCDTYVNGHQIGIHTTHGGSGWTSPNANTSFYARKGDVITGVSFYFKPLGDS